jgi:hypothetical protein
MLTCGTCGGWRLLVGRPSNQWAKIKRERDGASGVGDLHFTKTYNNQMNDGVGGGGCVGEEMRTVGTRGGWRSLIGVAFELNNNKK